SHGQAVCRSPPHAIRVPCLLPFHERCPTTCSWSPGSLSDVRISFLSVSDQLGGAEVALLEMIAALGRRRSDWKFQVVIPGDGPLARRLQDIGAACAIVRMPAALARLGEWSAVNEGWSAGAQMALGLRLCESAAVLPGYESRLRREVSAFQPDLIHTNGFKAH